MRNSQYSNSDNFKKLSVLAEILVSHEENECKFLISYKKYMYYVQYKLWFIPASFLKSIEFLMDRYNVENNARNHISRTLTKRTLNILSFRRYNIVHFLTGAVYVDVFINIYDLKSAQ